MSNKLNDKSVLAPKIAMLVAAIVMVAAFFLPFVSATGGYRERLLSNPDAVMEAGSVSMTNAEAADLSLMRYTMTYAGDNVPGMPGSYATFYAVLCGLPLVLAVLALALSFAKKPIGNTVIVALLVGVVCILVYDFESRGIVNEGGRMAFGYAQYVYYAAAGISVVASVWLFVVKHRLKKAQKAGQQPEAA